MLDSAKTALRKHAPGLAYFLKTVLRGPSGASRSSEATFSEIYARGTWGGAGDEPHSGSGSDDAVSAPFVDILRKVIIDKAIGTVVDLGCGDYRVGRRLRDLPIDYVGVDVVPTLVARNTAAFGSPRVRFVCRDITRDPLPTADLCVVRQVLQHLSNNQIRMVLDQLAIYRYALVAEHQPARLYRPNLDKDTGADTRIDFDSGVYLEHPPFNVANARLIASTPLPALLRDGERLGIYLIDNPAAGKPEAR
jgi:hypothetical protein